MYRWLCLVIETCYLLGRVRKKCKHCQGQGKLRGLALSGKGYPSHIVWQMVPLRRPTTMPAAEFWAPALTLHSQLYFLSVGKTTKVV